MKNSPSTSLVVSTPDVIQIVQRRGLHTVMDALIGSLASTFQHYDPSVIEIPVRAGFEYSHPQPGLVEWMPVLQSGERATIKVVGYHPGNPARTSLPSVISNIQQFDVSTGRLLTMVDATLLTALRTGAASAVASRILAHDSASQLGIIGCGAQAVAQVHGLSRVLPLRTVRFVDTDSATQANFAARCAGLVGSDVEFLPSRLADVVQASDVLCTATSITPGSGPLFQNLHYPSGAHINAIGSDFPGKTELPLDLLESSVVCPDFLQQAVLEGECQQLQPEQIGPDVVQLVKNPTEYEHLRHCSTVFDSTGFALEDDVAATLMVQWAREEGLGQYIESTSATMDPKDPYSDLRREAAQQTKGTLS